MATDNDWVYYSTLIPGYVKKYGLRGIRDRNRKLLKELKRSRSDERKDRCRRDLVENNLPLAKYAAERWKKYNNLSDTDAEDAFHDCVVAMSNFIHDLKKDDLVPNYFQVRLYTRMSQYLRNDENRKTLENTMTLEPFNEEGYVPQDDETTYGINKLLIHQIASHLMGPRDMDILWMYYGIDCTPCDLETIAERLGLTRERVRQLMVKSTKKLQRSITYSLNHREITVDDFIVENPEPADNKEKHEPSSSTSFPFPGTRKKKDMKKILYTFIISGTTVNEPVLLKEYCLKSLTLTRRHSVVTLNKIVAAQSGVGYGTRFMRDLTAVADENGLTLALTPDASFGASSVSRLKQFYGRFGFRENKGRYADYTINQSMIRTPQKTK